MTNLRAEGPVLAAAAKLRAAPFLEALAHGDHLEVGELEFERPETLATQERLAVLKVVG